MAADPILYYHGNRADISPDEPVFLAGFANRAGKSDSLHRQLKSFCMVLRQDSADVCLIFNDLMEMSHPYVQLIREKIAGATGIPVSHVFLIASHSHSAPIMDGMGLAWSEANEQYLNRAVALIADNAIRTIRQNEMFVPCRVRTGIGSCDINVNRRYTDPQSGKTVIGVNENGNCDKEVQVLQLINTGGDVLVTIFNYACHPVVLGHESHIVSPDFIGSAEEIVAGYFGGEAVFMAGACGDINPRNSFNAASSFADEEGSVLGNAVCLSELVDDPSDPVLKLMNSSIGLPYRDAHISGSYIADIVDLKMRETTDFTGWKKALEKWATKIKSLLEQHKVPIARTTALSALTIGSAVILLAQGEFFSSYHQRLKKMFTSRAILFAGYTNGETGYVPDAVGFQTGGYEVDQAYIFFNEPSPLAPESEDIALSAMTAIIREALPTSHHTSIN